MITRSDISMFSRMSRIFSALSLLLLSITIGVLGFMWVEGYQLAEAFYMTVITFSTVGYNEVHPLSENGRIFASFYIILNLGIIAYVVSVVSAYLFEGELNKLYRKYLSNKEVNRMNNHVIVCGFGRNGSKACEELALQGVDFVVIDHDEERIDKIGQFHKYKVIMGDATSDEVLIEAGIERARAVLTTLPNDAQNVFLSLTARELNPGIMIVSRASEESSEKKLLRAGATKVIMPDTVGGLHMAQHITKPVVIEYLDMLSGNGELVLEEIRVAETKKHFHGKNLEELDIRRNTGVSVIGYKNENEKFIFNPSPKQRLAENTVLIILGRLQEVDAFKQHFLA